MPGEANTVVAMKTLIAAGHQVKGTFTDKTLTGSQTRQEPVKADRVHVANVRHTDNTLIENLLDEVAALLPNSQDTVDAAKEALTGGHGVTVSFSDTNQSVRGRKRTPPQGTPKHSLTLATEDTVLFEAFLDQIVTTGL